MAVRVTVDEVKQIISTTQEELSLDAIILAANLTVTSSLTGSGLSAATLKEIERWLAAHLLAMSLDRQTQREEVGGDTNEEYAKLGLGLDATSYGQTVKALDTTGTLASLGKQRASITAVTSFED